MSYEQEPQKAEARLRETLSQRPPAKPRASVREAVLREARNRDGSTRRPRRSASGLIISISASGVGLAAAAALIAMIIMQPGPREFDPPQRPAATAKASEAPSEPAELAITLAQMDRKLDSLSRRLGKIRRDSRNLSRADSRNLLRQTDRLRQKLQNDFNQRTNL